MKYIQLNLKDKIKIFGENGNEEFKSILSLRYNSQTNMTIGFGDGFLIVHPYTDIPERVEVCKYVF